MGVLDVAAAETRNRGAAPVTMGANQPSMMSGQRRRQQRRTRPTSPSMTANGTRLDTQTLILYGVAFADILLLLILARVM